MSDETFDQQAEVERYAAGPDRLEAALAGLDEAGLDAAPAEGGWSIRQIVAHVVDGDQLWTLGLKATLGGEGVTFDFEWYWAHSQDNWAECWGYARRPIGPAIDLLRANRRHVMQIVEQLPGAWERCAVIRVPGGKELPITVGAIVAMQAEHIVEHTASIAAIRQARAI
jgi:hypothetical protein